MIDCIKKNEENSNTFILIVGSGTEYTKLESFVNQIKPNNTKLINQLPKNDYEILANSCDVLKFFFFIKKKKKNCSLNTLIERFLDTDIKEIQYFL